MPAYCPGCRKPFRSQDGRNRHLSQSHDERCIAARQPVSTPTNFIAPTPSSPPALSLPPPIREFVGDLFGTDYQDLPWLDEVSDDEGEAPQPAQPNEDYLARLRRLVEQDFIAGDDTFHDFWPTSNNDSEEIQADPTLDDYSPPTDAEDIFEANDIFTSPTDCFRFKPNIVHHPSDDAGAPVPPPENEDEPADDTDNPWAPFVSQLDWHVARWAKLRGPGSTAFSELLKLDKVRIFHCMVKSRPNCD